MRILHILDHSIPLQSGYSFRTRSILEHQRRLSWETVHVTGSKHYGSQSSEETIDGYRFYRTPQQTGLLLRLPVVNQYAVVRGLAKRLRQVVEHERPDILHAHSPCLNGLAALRVGRQTGLAVVYEVRAFWEDAAVNLGTTTEGSLRYRLSRALETHVLKRADAVTTICEGLRGEMLERGISSDKVTVIPNAVDPEQIGAHGEADPELLASLGLEGHQILGFIGSFYEYEGLDTLLRALPLVLAREPEARVLLVGGGPQESTLKKLATRLGVADKVVFAGRVPHTEIARYYALIDILVYARHSMRLTELVTPLKPLEAMAGGRMLVASNIGGHRELIRDGETGTLFTAGDPRALTDAVCGLLADRACWRERVLASRRFVENERSWARSVARYAAIYEHLIGARQPTTPIHQRVG